MPRRRTNPILAAHEAMMVVDGAGGRQEGERSTGRDGIAGEGVRVVEDARHPLTLVIRVTEQRVESLADHERVALCPSHTQLSSFDEHAKHLFQRFNSSHGVVVITYIDSLYTVSPIVLDRHDYRTMSLRPFFWKTGPNAVSATANAVFLARV